MSRAARWASPILAAVLAALTLYHISLLGRGALAWPDELLYRDALCAVDAAREGNIHEFARCLTGFGARPAEAVLRLIPAAIQKGLDRAWALSPFSPASLRIATAQNVLSSLLLSIVFYRLSLFFYAGDRVSSALATTMFSLLVANQVWVRHVVPYDTALAVDLAALLLCLRIRVPEETSANLKPFLASGLVIALGAGTYPLTFAAYRSAGLWLAMSAVGAIVLASRLLAAGWARDHVRGCMAAGLVSGLGLAAYPAWYSFHAGLGLIVALSGPRERVAGLSLAGIRAACLFGCGVLSVMFGFETLARLGEVSYLGSAARLSGTISGSVAQGLFFLPQLLLDVEGPIGALLCVFAAVAATAWARRGRAGLPFAPGTAALVRASLVMAAIYLVHGFQSTVLHRMNFTGRYSRIYVPFVVWAAVEAIRALPAGRMRQALLGLFVATSLASFASFATDYSRIDYPADALYRLGIGFEDLAPENVVYEAEIIPNYTLPVKAVTAGAAYVTQPHDDRFVIVNFGIFAPEGKHLGTYAPPANARLVYEASHFLTFRSSVFETLSIAKSQDWLKKAHRLKVYRLD